MITPLTIAQRFRPATNRMWVSPWYRRVKIDRYSTHRPGHRRSLIVRLPPARPRRAGAGQPAGDAEVAAPR